MVFKTNFSRIMVVRNKIQTNSLLTGARRVSDLMEPPCLATKPRAKMQPKE